jgi:lysophospholipase L1-like esterase
MKPTIPPMSHPAFLSHSRISGGIKSLFLAAAVLSLAAPTCAQAAPDKWEQEIAAFEASDRTNPPPANAILFVGSSSIRLWKTLARDFPDLPVINRGFGGSEVADSVRLASRIVFPYRPRQVVVYAGDNDLANGKTPEQVFADFKDFVKKVREVLPRARISYIAIKPSPSRWKLAAQGRMANRLIAEYCRAGDRLDFIDIFTPMLDQQGNPKEELFQTDKLHLNAAGYRLWADTVRPYLK